MLIEDKLEYWQKRLLDLGKRNRLINCPLPKDAKRVQRHSLLINTPTSNELWTLLSDGDNELTFNLPSDSQSQLEFGDSSTDDENSYINTNQTINETNKTLRSLMKKAKEFSEEKGINALHLAFGFLNWRENGIEGQELRSPLLLLPVKLSQADLFSPFILSRSDEEIATNYSLSQKLFSDFNVELPVLTEDTDFDYYLAAVSESVKSLGWSVNTDVVQLSLFSFLKINMYRDLEQNSDKITAHHIIRALNGELFGDGASIFDISECDHDSTAPHEVFSVVDADSSQQDSILMAKDGTSFVLQGPPGTGKSQTITNIIAELMAEGKSILFVSEKMAALEVVHKRLTQVGLGDFCLTLHSHKTRRREILDQLDKSVKLSRTKIQLQQDAHNSLYHLKETRDALNQYDLELHTLVKPFNKSVHQVNGLLSLLEDYRNIDFVLDNAEQFTPELLSQCQSALEELARVVDKSGYQQSNPWNGCALTQTPTHEFRQRFLVDTELLRGEIESGLELFREASCTFAQTDYEWRISDIDGIKRIVALTKRVPTMDALWMDLDIQASLINIDACVAHVHDICALNTELGAMQQLLANVAAASKETALCLYDNENSFPDVETYNSAFQARNTARDEHQKDTISKDKIEQELSTCEQAYLGEKASLDKATDEWHDTEEHLLQRCAKEILNVDAQSILARYRTDYRSWTRALSSSYRNDRKTILTHCKAAEKLSYEEGLSLLDTIVSVQTLKAKLEHQVEFFHSAKSLLDKTQQLHDTTSVQLNQSATALADAEIALVSAKTKMLDSTNAAVTIAEKKLKDANEQFPTQISCFVLSQDLGIELTQGTDFDSLRCTLEWCREFQESTANYRLGRSYINAICAQDVHSIKTTENVLRKLQSWNDSILPELEKFASIFDEERNSELRLCSLINLKEYVLACSENFSSLEYLIDYRIADTCLRSLGIGEYLDKAKEIGLAAEELIPVFKKCFYRAWIDAVTPSYPALRDFRRLRQDERVAVFKRLDKDHLTISKTMLLSKLISRLPNFDASSSNGEMALLRREMAKQRKLMPTRLLIAALPNLLPALKPCLMMSPLSVSTYLGISDYEFDTVIFDEASQVCTEDAIGAIFRAKQVIIAGDSKQLPPTDFFNSSISTSDEYVENEDGESDDAGAYESLLDEAVMLPTQTLLWHYRSRHEHLIAFSNAKIYQSSLITFPSSVEESDSMGVEYIHVAGGTYDRGGRNGNRLEAEKVAELVFEHFEMEPDRTLGIIAFGQNHQVAIQDALDAKRRTNPRYEIFFKEDKEEPLFIKNLETVQGDERDTIILSIGYASAPSGKASMNFGPINRGGGERRLNVAVTRARYNLKLVGSILPTDIHAEKTCGLGPKLLRLYIDFAINGANAILGEVTSSEELWFDSPFETSVYNFLTQHGFDVVTQVGCSGYRIDMAVRHPKHNGRFAIGIECDGAMYHSARTARERDRLRQTILEDMGWKIYRIWSTDWIKDRHTEGERLLNAVHQSIENYHEITPASKTAVAKLTDFAEVSTQSEQEHMHDGITEKFKNFKSAYYSWNSRDIPISDFAETMLKVIVSSFGLDKTGVFKETALYGYGWERQGSIIKDKFENAYSGLLTKKAIEELSNGKVKLVENPLSNC